MNSRKTAGTGAETRNLTAEQARIHRFKEIGFLSRGVAHDLNSILSGIATYPDILLMDDGLDQDTRYGLTIIRDAGQKAADMVSDFLLISTGITAEKTPVSLNHLLDEFFRTPEFNMLKAAYPVIPIDVQLEPELLRTEVSYSHMEKTIHNLLWFACSSLAGAGNGQVMVITSNIYSDKKTMGKQPTPPGEYVSLQVHITGIGLETEHCARLFEPFYTRNVMKKEGTGLEMALVWNTIQDHDGSICLTSGPDDIRFDLAIPAFRRSAEEDAVLTDDIKGNQEAILVIDLHPAQGKIACDILGELGYHAWIVGPGPEAIMNIKQEPMDLILLDAAVLNGKEGADVFRAIKSLPGHRKVILAHTGVTGSIPESKMIRKMDIKTFVKKPYTILDLGIAIKEELGK